MTADIRVHAVLDPDHRRPGTRAAIAGGATLLQCRDKTSDTRTLVARAREIVAAAAARLRAAVDGGCAAREGGTMR